MMYTSYFGLKEAPFSIAPDPRYLFMSERYREALAHLLFGIKSDGGFVLLTGEVGTGKTTVCRCLLEQIPEDTDVAFLFNPKLTAVELLAAICDELRIAYPAGNTSIKTFLDRIIHTLLAAHAKGRKTVLIIDEAQNLAPDVLEQVRLLTNLETNQKKLLQIILLGQPELLKVLKKPELRQLDQRITARFHLGPLSKKELTAYVAHRLGVAGAERNLFPAATIRQLYRLSGGIPRLVNMLCDRSLLGAYVRGKPEVSRTTLRKAAVEIFGKDRGVRQKSVGRKGLMTAALLLAVAALLSGAIWQARRTNLPPKTPQVFRGRIPRVNGAEGKAGSGSSKLAALAWPVDRPILKSKEMAYHDLFKQWGLSYRAGENGLACDFAEAHGLHCLHRRGSLGSLRRLNRPAILLLTDRRGQAFYALLVSLGRETARFVMGGETRTVAKGDLESHWHGEFSILWRLPPGYHGTLRRGARGPEVSWLDGQLAALRGQPVPDRPATVLEGALYARLREFQVTAGLAPDGVVGPRTLIGLNTALGKGVPLLLADKEGS